MTNMDDNQMASLIEMFSKQSCDITQRLPKTESQKECRKMQREMKIYNQLVSSLVALRELKKENNN